MFNFFEDASDRQVVPRWRDFTTSFDCGELEAYNPLPGLKIPVDSIQNLLNDWSNNPGLSTAGDLVSAALTLDSIDAVQAAQQILENENSSISARRVAESYLSKVQFSLSNSVDHNSTPVGSHFQDFDVQSVIEQLRIAVHVNKLSLIRHPRNPVKWCGLARLYVSLGQNQQASHAMKVSLWLAPTNRYILRSASRMFLHQGFRDQAHHILMKTSNVKFDPWLLAAEIATSAANGKTSKYVKTAQKMIANQNYSPFHLSELASALGTIEIGSGKTRSGRRLIELSLIKPAENAIAQAAWLGRREGKSHPTEFVLTNSSEANAWEARANSRWQDAKAEFSNWQNYEPFSSRPALFGSSILGNALEEYDLAVEVLKRALLSNSSDASLLNNLAWSLAHVGKTIEARKVISQTKSLSFDSLVESAIIATNGLISYREGNILMGRSLYESAIMLAKKNRDIQRESLALVNLALEEKRAQTLDAPNLSKQALLISKNLTDPIYSPLIERLAKSNS